MTPPSCHSLTQLDLSILGGDKIVMSKLWREPGRIQAGEKMGWAPSRRVFIWKKKTIRASHCELGQGLLTDQALFLKTQALDLLRVLSSYFFNEQTF